MGSKSFPSPSSRESISADSSANTLADCHRVCRLLLCDCEESE